MNFIDFTFFQSRIQLAENEKWRKIHDERQNVRLQKLNLLRVVGIGGA